jgi:hypothetical protein
MYNSNYFIQFTRGDTWFNIPALWMENQLLYEEIKQVMKNVKYNSLFGVLRTALDQ